MSPFRRAARGGALAPVCSMAATLLLLLLLPFCSPATVTAATYGSKIEAGETECYTEIVEAGGTLGFTFRVTDGGAFDVNAVMKVRSTPPVDKTTELSRFHYNARFAGLRDRQRETVLNTWQRATDGSYTYTAPSVLRTRHGLPEEVSVCFDNSFSTLSPKWVRFNVMKRDVMEVDPDAVGKVENAMEEELHRYGSILFGLAQDANALQLVGESDRVKLNALATIMAAGLVLNVMVLLTMATYQYVSLSRFLARQVRHGKFTISTK
ncbi:putative emp24/gp25L/p24 family/GOLD [Leishmania naiffi]|uniref:Emp24/gp25L/p24 family/GOLD n=1 Tax=Leishmania naiffi TaxID=5678 RepID=A0AAW3BFQ5_9TRYP